MGDDVLDEGHVAGTVDFGYHEGGEVGRLEDFGEVVEGEAGGDGVDADGTFFCVLGNGLVDCLADEAPGVGFVAGCNGVFEVVGQAVGG